MEKLRSIVEDSDTPAGRAFDIFTIGAIIFSLILFPFETIPELAVYEDFFRLAEIITITIFMVEYGLRLIVARHKLRYVFSFYGLIDLVAILPFFILSGVDLRSLRMFRLLRLLRILKLTRYSLALQRLKLAFTEIREELVVYLVMTLFVVYIASIGIYYFEHEVQPEVFKSVPHAMWWAVATLTTVGYGDIYPITDGGKVFTFVILIFGLGVVAVPPALLAAALARGSNPLESSTD